MSNCGCNTAKNDFSRIDAVINEYKGQKGSLITILQKAQEICGYLPKEVIYHIARGVGTTPAEVMGVATFYTQFRLKPVGKYLIMFCQGTACHVNGSERIMNAVCEKLGIGDGETTDDGMFSIKSVACLGCCSLSPVMMINGETYGSLTTQKALEIIDRLSEEGNR